MHLTNNHIYEVGAAKGRLKGTGTFYNFKNIYQNCHIMPNLQTTNQYWKCICVCEGSGTAEPPIGSMKI